MFNLVLDVSKIEKEVQEYWEDRIKKGCEYANQAWLRESLPKNAIDKSRILKGQLKSISEVTFSEEFISKWIDPTNIRDRLRVYEMYSDVIRRYVIYGEKTTALRFFIEGGMLKAEVIKGEGYVVNARNLEWLEPGDLMDLLIVRRQMENVKERRENKIEQREAEKIAKEEMEYEKSKKTEDFSEYHNEQFQTTSMTPEKLREILIESGGERVPIPSLYYKAQVTRDALHTAIWAAADRGWLMMETIPYSDALNKDIMSLTIPTDDDSYIYYITYVPTTGSFQPHVSEKKKETNKPK